MAETIAERFLVLARRPGSRPTVLGPRSVLLPRRFDRLALESSLHYLRQEGVQVEERPEGQVLLLVSRQVAWYRDRRDGTHLCPTCYASAEDGGTVSDQTHRALFPHEVAPETEPTCRACGAL